MHPRVIDDFEFVWMLRGEALFVAGEEELHLLPGHLLLVPPGLRHNFIWDQRRPSRHGYVHFHSEQVSEPDEEPVRLRRMTEQDPLAGLCAYLIWLGREQPSGWERHVRQALQFLMAVFTSGSLPADETHPVLSPPLSTVVDHLRRVWSEMPLRPIGVDELASTARVSRSYLSRLFQAEFGISVAACAEGLRLARAETLLVRTDMTISSIARHCGFADLYHFSHRFTRHHGVPPSVYRNEGAPSLSMLDHPGTRRLAHAVWD